MNDNYTKLQNQKMREYCVAENLKGIENQSREGECTT